MPDATTWDSALEEELDYCSYCDCQCPSGCDCELSDEGCSYCNCGDVREYCESCECECESCSCTSRECRNCDCDNSPSFDLVKSYSDDVLRYVQFQGNPKDGTYFGVELEVNTREECYNDAAVETMERLGETFCILKHDGSIGIGFEIVTAPATLEIHRDKWKPFFESRIKGMSSWSSGRCGMHVHVSRPSEYHTGKILEFMNNRAHQQQIVDIAGRNSDQWSAFRNKKITDGKRERAGYRYEAVNTTPSQTIEFRLFRGTINPERFFRNLEFVHAVVYWARDVSAKQMSWAEFTKYVTKHSEDYPTLGNYLRGDDRYRIGERSTKIVLHTTTGKGCDFPKWAGDMEYEYPTEKVDQAKKARLHIQNVALEKRRADYRAAQAAQAAFDAEVRSAYESVSMSARRQFIPAPTWSISSGGFAARPAVDNSFLDEILSPTRPGRQS